MRKFKKRISNYVSNYKTVPTRLFKSSAYERDFKTGTKIRQSKRKSKKLRTGLSPFVKGYITTPKQLPPCTRERKITRRAYFSFKKSRPHVSRTGASTGRFKMRKCK